MTARWIVVLGWLAGGPALAQKPKEANSRATDVAAFQRDLDKVFVEDGLTADAAASRAAKVAPLVARKTASVEAAAAELSRAKKSLVPIIGGKVAYTRLSPIDDVVLPLGPMSFIIRSLQNSISVSGQVSVPLSDYLVRDGALIGGADHALTAARMDRRATATAIGYQSREIYYEWLRAKLQVLVAKRQLAQVDSTLAQIKTLVDVQRASTADLARVESQRAQAKQILDRLANGVILREEQLRLAIGAPADEKLAIGEDVRGDVEVPELGDFDELARRAAGKRAELKALESGIRAKESLRRAEGSTLFPKVSAVAAVEYADPNPRVFPQADELRTTWAAGVQLTWVLNESLVASDARGRLAAEADELRADRVSLQHRIRLEVLSAYQAVTLARSAIEASQQGVQAAEEGYRIRKDLFAAGRASVVEMVDIEAELARARIAALDARIDLRIALAKLAYSTGQ